MSLHAPAGLPARFASYGASGTCVHVAHDLRFQAAGSSEFIGYVSDVPDDPAEVDFGYPILSFEELKQIADVGVFVAVHDQVGRRDIFTRLEAAAIPIVGSRGTPHLAHPEATLGEGVIVTSTTHLGHNTTLGRGTLALGDLVAHDVVIGEFVTLAAHSRIAGHVIVGDNVFVGMGAIILNGTARRPLRIGDGAVIGAGAVVDRDVAPGEVLVSPRALRPSAWARLRRLADRETP